jgi:hypothetical protein
MNEQDAHFCHKQAEVGISRVLATVRFYSANCAFLKRLLRIPDRRSQAHFGALHSARLQTTLAQSHNFQPPAMRVETCSSGRSQGKVQKKEDDMQVVPETGYEYSCWICDNILDLRTCVTDEDGIAVHPDCYLTMLALQSITLTKKPPVTASEPTFPAAVEPLTGVESQTEIRTAKPCFLRGWKQIANYLHKGVRTVQRYEHSFGLPVRRPSGGLDGVVTATCAEIDRWVMASTVTRQTLAPQPVARPRTANTTQPYSLKGWKQIARYLRKGVRTVQRYERNLALPVQRPAGRLDGPVAATPVQIDQWVMARTTRPMIAPAARPFIIECKEMRKNLLQLAQSRGQLANARCELVTTVARIKATTPYRWGKNAA